MLRFISNSLLCMLAVMVLAAPCLAQSNEENKRELVRSIRHVGDSGDSLQAYMVEQLITFRVSPEVWRLLLEGDGGRRVFTAMAMSLSTMAKEFGWGDMTPLYTYGTDPAQNPLIADMMAQWKQKMSVTVVAEFAAPAAQRDQILSNLDLCSNPMQNTFVNKPRSGRFFVNLILNPKAHGVAVNVSKDAAHFEIVLPVFVAASQLDIENGLKKGMR